VLLVTLIQVFDLLVSFIIMFLIVQFVLSLLITFNVINTRNQFVEAIWRAINALLEPMLGPIRRILPHTGAIDFSPMALFIALKILQIILHNLAASIAQ
jgi:YggT family protein